MPRRIGGEDKNELRLQDNLSGSEIVLYYRMPTTEERIAYSNAGVQRRGAGLAMRLGEARQEYGAMILTGFRTGDFEKKKGDEYVPMASEPGSPHHDPDWKKHLQAHASDLIELLACRVFDASATVLNSTDRQEPEEDDAERD